MSQAYSWLYGPLPNPLPVNANLPWPSATTSLAPLGYTASPDRQGIVPTYAPGLPLMMAGFLRVAGPRGPYLVVPIFAGLMVWSTFVLGRRIGGVAVGAMATLFVAVSPIVMFQALSPMTDVPIGALWTAVAAVSLSESRWSPALSGLLAAVAVMVRPNLPLLTLVFVLHFLLTGATWRAGLIRAATFAMLVAPAVIAVAALNSRWYGSPFNSGYGSAGQLYSISSIWPNLQRYPVWLVQSHSALSLLCLLPLILWKRLTVNRNGLRLAYLLVAATWLSYLPYFAFEEWWYLRFMLPSIPAILILVSIAMITLGRLAPFPWSRMVTCALAATMFIAELRYTLDRDLFGPMYFGEQRYVTVGLYMRRILPANGVVFAIQHSGSLRFYTGRPTVRYDLVDDSWVSRAPAAATQAGYHPFAVFEDPEMPQLRSMLNLGPNGALPWRLIARLNQPVGVTVYDLAPEGDPQPPVALSIGDGHRAVRGGGY